MTMKLKTCPFCGAAARLRAGITYAAVICVNCDSKGPTCEGEDYCADAVKLWNRRDNKNMRDAIDTMEWIVTHCSKTLWDEFGGQAVGAICDTLDNCRKEIK